MDEFSMGSSCETSYYKKTVNPHNFEYVPGGSSGGSAACVCAGEAVVTVGADTGGSIRQPASYCGVVGLRPTYGAVSRYGLVAMASSLDQIGPMGRTVEDVAMLFHILSGRDKKDATSFELGYDYLRNDINNLDCSLLKIGLVKEYFDCEVNPEVFKAVIANVKELEKMGAKVKEVSIPSVKYALAAYYILCPAEISSNFARFDGIKYGYCCKNYTNLENLYKKTRSEGFGDEVKRRIMIGTFFLSHENYDNFYNKAVLICNKIKREFNDAFLDCDVLISPTAPDVAFKFGERLNLPKQMYASDICTIPSSMAGIPSISMNCGVDKKGLPIGMQIMGNKNSEPFLFKVAKIQESLCSSFCKLEDI
jgi:aspartyl-tRNA(Asn)/glutamyl-tRNA(Gln) amidotransferase subunit A